MTTGELPVLRPGYQHHLQPTPRGWLFMGRHGGPCDKSCLMCYYAFQNQLTFYTLDTLLATANLFRHHYGLAACDISGGEATIFGPKDKQGRRPQLEALVRHCAQIGLRPTIITHGQNNTAELVAGLEGAGLEDWLISLHGMPSGHEQTVVDHQGKGAGGWQRLVDGLKHITRPVRFNFTAQNFNYRELPELSRWLADNQKPTVWNIIRFNPFFAWNERPDIDFQEKQTAMAPYVGEAVAIAEAAGWEVNCRYFEPCIAAPHGFAKNCVGFYQTQYDEWEWSLSATNRTPKHVADQVGGWHQANLLHCNQIADGRANDKCKACRFFGTVCEGPPEQYVERYGLDEFTPSAGQRVTDPTYFAKGGAF